MRSVQSCSAYEGTQQRLEGLPRARHCARLQECGRRPNNALSPMELAFGGWGRQIINKYKNKCIPLRDNM